MFAIGSWAVRLIILIAVIAVVYVFANAAGVVIPGFLVTLFWIVAIAALCIVAIKYLAGLA